MNDKKFFTPFLKKSMIHLLFCLSLAAHAGGDSDLSGSDSESENAKKPKQENEARQPEQNQPNTLEELKRKLIEDLLKNMSAQQLIALIQEKKEPDNTERRVPATLIQSIRANLINGSQTFHIINQSRVKNLDEDTLYKQFMKSVKKSEPTIIQFDNMLFFQADETQLLERCNKLNLPIMLQEEFFLERSSENVVMIDVCLATINTDINPGEWIRKAERNKIPIRIIADCEKTDPVFRSHPDILAQIFEKNQVCFGALSSDCLDIQGDFQSLKRLALFGHALEPIDHIIKLINRRTPNLISLDLTLLRLQTLEDEDFPLLKLTQLKEFSPPESCSIQDLQKFCKILPRHVQYFTLKNLRATETEIEYIANSFDSLKYFSATVTVERSLIDWLNGLKNHKNLSVLELNFSHTPWKSSDVLQKLCTTDAQKKEERETVDVLFPEVKTLCLAGRDDDSFMSQKGFSDMIISILPLIDFHQKESDTTQKRPIKYIDFFSKDRCHSSYNLLILKLLKFSGSHVHFILKDDMIKSVKNTDLLDPKDEKRLKTSSKWCTSYLKF